MNKVIRAILVGVFFLGGLIPSTYGNEKMKSPQEGECYLLINSTGGFSKAVVHDVVATIVSQFYQPIIEVPLFGIPYDSTVCTYGVSVSRKSEDSTVSVNLIAQNSTKGSSGIAESNQKGFRGLKEAILLAIYTARRDLEGDLCKYYGDLLLSECTGGKRKQNFGTSFIDSQPGGATVYFDGKNVGITPLRAFKTQPGTHRIRVKKEGYQDWTEVFVFDAGQEYSQFVQLQNTENNRYCGSSTPVTCGLRKFTKSCSIRNQYGCVDLAEKVVYAVGVGRRVRSAELRAKASILGLLKKVNMSEHIRLILTEDNKEIMESTYESSVSGRIPMGIVDTVDTVTLPDGKVVVTLKIPMGMIY